MKTYQYTECGLSNVFIDDVDVVQDDQGEETYTIKNILGLHKVIAHAIISRPRQRMTGEEFRFLRSEMGLTQEEAGKRLGRDRVTISRWERGETTIDPAVETVMKVLAIEKLGIDPDLSVEEMASQSDWAVEVTEIRIDGKNPSQYRLAA